jgi:hypothetical protein
MRHAVDSGAQPVAWRYADWTPPNRALLNGACGPRLGFGVRPNDRAHPRLSGAGPVPRAVVGVETHRLSLGPRDAAFLVTCLRLIGADAPCRARIELVIDAIADDGGWRGCHVPETVFARGISIAAVIWAIDSGVVGVDEHDVAQGVLEELWRAGPVRPDLIGSQIRCVVSQPTDEGRCRWICPAMRHANAGYAQPDGAISRGPLPNLAWTVAEAASASPEPDRFLSPLAPRWLPRRGACVRCPECGRPGTILGVDSGDGWTVLEHHPPVVQREDGMWEVEPTSAAGPKQCRYVARLDDARIG